MRKGLKVITFMTALIMLSSVGQVWAVAQDSEYEVETVGGKLSPINFIMTFLVPVLVIIGIFAVMVIAGLIRIEIETHENEDAPQENND